MITYNAFTVRRKDKVVNGEPNNDDITEALIMFIEDESEPYKKIRILFYHKTWFFSSDISLI